VSDDCKIGIDALSDVRGELDIEFFLRSVHSLFVIWRWRQRASRG
jgi:hypothetical protein